MAKANLKPIILEALEKSLGIITIACKEVGIQRKTFYSYYENDLEFRKAVDDINEITLDFAENQLLKSIKEGSDTAIQFYLKKKGKKRGYGDNLDVNISSNKVIFKFNISEDYENRDTKDS